MPTLFSPPKAPAPPPPPPPPPEPTAMPDPDDTRLQALKRRQVAQRGSRSGRASTILSQGGRETLGGS